MKKQQPMLLKVVTVSTDSMPNKASRISLAFKKKLELESSKRKLQLRYQQVQNAKRKIQLVDLRDMPKPEPEINFAKKSKYHRWSACWCWTLKIFLYIFCLDSIWFFESFVLTCLRDHIDHFRIQICCIWICVHLC